MHRTFPAAFCASLLGTLAAAQASCTGAWVPGGAAFLVDCPCGPVSDPLLYFQGTARIGSVQRFVPNSTAWSVPAAFLVIGLVPATPTPVPFGLVACGSYASLPMVPINAVAIDPLLVVPIAFFDNGSSSGPSYYPLPHHLFIPYLPQAVGLTLHAQYFQQEFGTGSVPFAASHTIGFTLQP